MSNEIITLVKDTSLARVIGIAEVVMCAERFTKQGLIWPLFFTGLYYLIFVGAIILIYATWTIVVLGGIYLLFLVGYWLWELFRLLIRYMRGSVVA